jgi:hypothetical protein
MLRMVRHRRRRRDLCHCDVRDYSGLNEWHHCAGSMIALIEPALLAMRGSAPKDRI